MVWQRGIDSAAHQGAIEAEGKTIAVLGGGFDHIFPRENIPLYRKILEKGGAVITEYAPEVSVQSSFFLARNRIVSGMSMGTLVVEAMHRSGTSVTASLARQQGRKVFCVSYPPDDKHGVRHIPLTKRAGKPY